LASHASVGGEIIDTHHHFWDRPDHRYLLDDLANGHNIDATVFLECRSMRSARMRSLAGHSDAPYRAAGGMTPSRCTDDPPQERAGQQRHITKSLS
jgi:hypothetical protein